MLRKWRPTLSMIVTAMIAVALILPLTGILFFRLYENQLVRNAEAELIAQSAAIAASMSVWLETQPDAELPLGPEIPPRHLADGVRWAPIEPRLSLHSAKIFPPRPQARAGDVTAPAIYGDLAAFLFPIMMRTQQATLAGFRILDASGTVIAGRHEVGLSLAHLPEVQAALQGSYASVLRKRVVDNPQPIYSISRGTSIRLFTAMPVIVGNRLAGVVYASRTPSNVVKELYLQRNRLALIVLTIVVAAILMVLIFSRTIANPIRHLRERAQRIGRGDREAIGPMRRYGSREVYQLANELMVMSRKLFDRNDYINTFAAHVSHELKSPFTSIMGAVELLKDGGMAESERARFLDNIARDAARGSRLLERLRALGKADSVDIQGDSALMAVVSDCQDRFPQLEIVCKGDVVIPMSHENLAIVFDNLLDNAAKHEARTIWIEASERPNSVAITIQDDGTGISPGNASLVFDLFFTTRRQSDGTGLGLGIVRSLLKAHGGSIDIVECEDGACFEIRLPLPPS